MAQKLQTGDAETTSAGDGYSVVRWGTIIAAGMFTATMALPDTLDLPIKNLLRTELQLGRDQVSLFMSLAALPWYFKIFAGLLSDCFPLFGTRRRYYLIFSATLGAVFWLIAGSVPHGYWPLLLALLATHTMLVFISTVTAGLIVDAGKRFGAEGQLVTVRIVVESGCGIIAGPVAGFLAGQSFGWTGVFGATIAFGLVPVVALLLREPPAARYDAATLATARGELGTVLRSRTLWLTALFLMLAMAPSSFGSSLYFHQTGQLGFANSDIGYLNSMSAIANTITATVYGVLRARLSLRALLVAAIIGGAAATSAFAFYRSWDAAIGIEILHGVIGTVSVLVLMEVAVRATPASVAAMGFALMMSAWNVGVAIGDYAGAWLIERHLLTFYGLAPCFALLSALVLLALPILPREVFVEPRIDGAPGGD